MRTDSLGRIHFADVPPGQYSLSVGDRDAAPVALEVKAGEDPEPVRLTR